MTHPLFRRRQRAAHTHTARNGLRNFAKIWAAKPVTDGDQLGADCFFIFSPTLRPPRLPAVPTPLTLSRESDQGRQPHLLSVRRGPVESIITRRHGCMQVQRTDSSVARTGQSFDIPGSCPSLSPLACNSRRLIFSTTQRTRQPKVATPAHKKTAHAHRTQGWCGEP